ncbi:MAG: C39 family peptidase [Chthoniobacteraceae bacterium]|nr:C39 family peptidase [Chthoniobacteraceae bacterium]
MKKLLLTLFCCIAAAAAPAQAPNESPTPEPTPAAPTPLDPALFAETVWDSPGPQWVEANKALGFHWISAAHDTAQSTRKGAKLLEIPVCQTLARFEGERLKEITVLFYNRGDMGTLGRRDYDALIKKAVDAVSTATKVQFVPRGRDASNAVRADGVTWTTPRVVYLLEYSCTHTPEIPFRAEFVRLRISPGVDKSKGFLAASFEATKKAAAPFRGTDHVTRDVASGDVVIKDVPMVDQGQKGYCVVAASERLLRYYGIQADANELAQLANSSAEEGTSVRAMMESLKKLTARLKIRVRPVYEISFEQLIADYQQAAKRAKDTGINPSVQDLGALYEQMKPDILRAARTKSKSEMGAFQRHVKTRIDGGYPLLWAVVLGVLPDGSPAKVPSGHMRLIIGYNEKTQEILFSDTWGAGHELKRMPLVDAWAITNYLSTVEPF